MRTTMRTIVVVATLALALGTALPAGADQQRSGIVEAVDAERVTVSGRSYTIDAETELVDRGGARIAPHELVPGTPAELDLDDDGRLITLRAALVR